MADSSLPGARGVGATAISRRTVIAAGIAGVAGLALTGCGPGDADSPTGQATPAELSPDVATATRALTEITAVRLGVAATMARHPSLRKQLAPLTEMHLAHEASVADAVPARARTSASPAPYTAPRRPDVALNSLARLERTLHDTLGTLALGAESGAFARLLASMGAAVGQRLAGWPA